MQRLAARHALEIADRAVDTIVRDLRGENGRFWQVLAGFWRVREAVRGAIDKEDGRPTASRVERGP
jgi:hypothetical protein